MGVYWDVMTFCDRLPEDIERMKWAGDWDGAKRRIGYLLGQDIPHRLRARLALEGERIEDIRRSYCYDREAALSLMREKVPDFTEADLDRLDDMGATDFTYENGKRKYLRSFRSTLLKVNPEIRARAGIAQDASPTKTDLLIKEIMEKGEKRVRLHIRASLRVRDGAFVKGETYTVHLPIPAPSEQTKDIALLGFSHEPYRIAPEDAWQRTVCFKETLQENETFWVEYEYTQDCRYYWYGDTERVYSFDAPPTEADLAEEQPHLVFTPYLRALHDELAGDEKDPLAAAKKFYDYITKHITYSYVRHYSAIDHGAEYLATNLKGDCGLQALLFIALCRMHGIPARWQSGLAAEPGDVGCHDWAQFYIEGPGWLFCDPSYGGGAVRSGKEWRREFYFGNLEPYRMAANRGYAKPFDPPKSFFRADPFDSQDGEAETSAGPLFGKDTETEQECREVE